MHDLYRETLDKIKPGLSLDPEAKDAWVRRMLDAIPRRRRPTARTWRPLAWRGDALIYMAATDLLMMIWPQLQSGRWGPVRSYLLSNDNLADLGHDLGISRFIPPERNGMTRDLGAAAATTSTRRVARQAPLRTRSSAFRAARERIYRSTARHPTLGDRTVKLRTCKMSDGVEAMVGAAEVHYGRRGAVRLAQVMLLEDVVDLSPDEWLASRPSYEEHEVIDVDATGSDDDADDSERGRSRETTAITGSEAEVEGELEASDESGSGADGALAHAHRRTRHGDRLDPVVISDSEDESGGIVDAASAASADGARHDPITGEYARTRQQSKKSKKRRRYFDW